MKYVLMFTSNPELDAAVPDERAEADMQRIFEWHVANGDSIIDGGAVLHGPDSATTVRATEGTPAIINGPFSDPSLVTRPGLPGANPL